MRHTRLHHLIAAHVILLGVVSTGYAASLPAQSQELATGGASVAEAAAKHPGSVSLGAPCAYESNFAISGSDLLQCRDRKWSLPLQIIVPTPASATLATAASPLTVEVEVTVSPRRGAPETIRLFALDHATAYRRSLIDESYLSGTIDRKPAATDIPPAPMVELKSGLDLSVKPAVSQNGDIIVDLHLSDNRLDSLADIATSAGTRQVPSLFHTEYEGSVSLKPGVSIEVRPATDASPESVTVVATVLNAGTIARK